MRIYHFLLSSVFFVELNIFSPCISIVDTIVDHCKNILDGNNGITNNFAHYKSRNYSHLSNIRKGKHSGQSLCQRIAEIFEIISRKLIISICFFPPSQRGLDHKIWEDWSLTLRQGLPSARMKERFFLCHTVTAS